jgi:predicted HAD superfamily Cof-like phosphohydrolase
MTNHQRTAAWLAACGKTPNVGNASLQAGCMLEEIGELLATLRVDSDGWQRVLERAVTDLQDLATEIKKGKRIAHIPNHLRAEALDAMCDVDVTINGLAYLSGMDKDGADAAVLDSNDAKLVDGKPVLLPGGKIGKPAGWAAPVLKTFV